MTLFNELDHRLSVVKRWSILHTIQEQSVAEHSFNVARITERLCRDVFMIPSGDAVIYALHHDDLESVMGDPPSMMKRYINEAQILADHSEFLTIPEATVETQRIVKLADKLEAYHFLSMEYRMGNGYVTGHLEAMWDTVVTFVANTWPHHHDLGAFVKGTMNGFVQDNESQRFSD